MKPLKTKLSIVVLLVTCLSFITAPIKGGVTDNDKAPNNIIIISHRVHGSSEVRQTIAIHAKDLHIHLKHGDWAVPYNDEIHKHLKIVGTDDDGAI